MVQASIFLLVVISVAVQISTSDAQTRENFLSSEMFETYEKRAPMDRSSMVRFGKRAPMDRSSMVRFGKRALMDRSSMVRFGKRVPLIDTQSNPIITPRFYYILADIRILLKIILHNKRCISSIDFLVELRTTSMKV
ncbi:hypothetical protein RB195_025238 [Necator americanus]|uniref:Uncharacterized protein n=1 Tax=Necator americanus TaxID=51031 RepID=A0ABR1ERF1_NECAM